LPVRRALAAVLALPVLASIYLAIVLRRGPAAWAALALGVGALAVAAVAAAPTGTIGAPTATQAPLAATAWGPAVATDRALTAAMVIDFGAPMDPVSVARAVRVSPAAEYRLSWSDDGTRLFVSPVGSWQPATYYTITVGTEARDRTGRQLVSPLRAGFLTREATTTSLAVTEELSQGVALDGSIALTFDRPVSVASVAESLRIAPSAPGRLVVASDESGAGDAALAEVFLWEPVEPLAAETPYTVALADGVTDGEGGSVAVPEPLTFVTTPAPSVVRFRPRANTENVGRSVDVSVRFTMPMDRESTRRAFSVEVNGEPVSGRVWFAEDDTVLVLDPEAEFPHEATVVLRVAESAQSAEGTPLDRARSVTFSVESRPPPAPTPAPASGGPAPRATPAPTQPSARPTSASWLAAERYLLELMNDRRAAVGVPALQYHAGVSDRAARPFAELLAVHGACAHSFRGQDPGDRLRAAGFVGRAWGENIGCRFFIDPRDAAESLVRFFMGSPGHYANMVSRRFTHAGIGFWVHGRNLRFVVKFYTP
jgi:uncharacterized protein YkwD